MAFVNFSIFFSSKKAPSFDLAAPQTCIYECATCHVTLFGRGTGGDVGHFVYLMAIDCGERTMRGINTRGVLEDRH
jgi:hypothetical protein